MPVTSGSIPTITDYVCKLDLDLRMAPRYFETLIARMQANPRLASCSGKSCIEHDGKLVAEIHGDENSIGASKFYRVTCFKAIGGFVREVMWGRHRLPSLPDERLGHAKLGTSRTCGSFISVPRAPASRAC